MAEAFNWIKNLFVMALEYLHGMTGSWAMAIILLTIGVRVVIAPLFVVQMRSMKKMQELQPELAKLKERYKNDPEKLNREMMDMYRKEKVNPFAGCLPLLVQMPFLIAFYQALYAMQFDERLFGLIPLGAPSAAEAGAWYMWIMPILAGVSTFGSTWLSSGGGKDPTQKAMLYIMPVMIIWFSRQVSAGVALYWVVSTVVGMVQQWMVTGFPKPQGEAGAK